MPCHSKWEMVHTNLPKNYEVKYGLGWDGMGVEGTVNQSCTVLWRGHFWKCQMTQFLWCSPREKLGSRLVFLSLGGILEMCCSLNTWIGAQNKNYKLNICSSWMAYIVKICSVGTGLVAAQSKPCFQEYSLKNLCISSIAHWEGP